MKKCTKAIPTLVGILGGLFKCTGVYAVNLRTMYAGNPFQGVGQTIVNGVYWIGLCVLVGAVIVKGIQYVSSAPDGKAAIKKDLFMLIMGAFLITCAYSVILLIKQSMVAI